MNRRHFLASTLATAALAGCDRVLPTHLELAATNHPVTIADCALLEANTLHNPAWLPADAEMVYRYPGVPRDGSWTGSYRDLMRFRSCSDITAARAELRRRIWRSPDGIVGAHDRMAVVGDHEEYEVDMPYWRTTSRCWLYRAARPTGTLLIVHGGHDNHGPLHRDLVPIRQEVLAEGHDVLVMSMPGQSVNIPHGPTGEWFYGTNGPFSSHQNLPHFDQFFLARQWIGNPWGVPLESGLHVFYGPVHRMINAIGSRYDTIAMTGLSGGAATAISCAALDPRIVATYAVAGSGVAPRFAYYARPGNFGDNENQVKTWLEVANEEETLTMIADGGRRAIVVLNDHDPCCLSASDIDVTLYKAAVEYESGEVGQGTVDVVVDANNMHSWSPAVRRMILDDLAACQG